MTGMWLIARLTLHEAMRKRILLTALIFGLGLVTLFAIGFHFVARQAETGKMTLIEKRMAMTVVTLAALYATNVLTVMTAALLPVDTLSGEIASGAIQTLAVKPLRRETIVLGKWLGNAIAVLAFLGLVTGGVLLVIKLRAGITLPNVEKGLPLMALEALVVVSLSIAGGSRLATLANGMTVFGLYGIAFIGGWIEQIGTLINNDTTRNIGVIASLIMPSESMWQLAAHHMQPSIMRQLQISPFSPASVPSAAMVVWAAGYAVVMVVVGMRTFRNRPL